MEVLASLTLAELARRIHAREVTSVQATEAVLAQIDRLNPRVNAFITVLGDEALHEAKAADDLLRARHDLGPLHGVPIALKDLIATRGIRTTAGSRILADWTPQEDAAVTLRLRQAGAVLVGKTNLDEFAFGGSGENAHYGDIHNPWDLERTAGGSSGGSAAAVAARMVYGALGSDTAASIRNPAHFCGIVGLKPTFGRVSRRGVVPLAWSLDTVGPLTRTVEDAAIVLGAIAGYDAGDPTTSRRRVPNYLAVLNEPIEGLRVGVLRGYFWEPIEPAVGQGAETALEVLRGLGARLQDVELPHTDLLYGLRGAILEPEAAAAHLRWMQERPGDYAPVILQRLQQGALVAAVDYVNAQRARALFQTATRELLRRVDVLAMPTVPYVATKLGQAIVRVGDVEMEASPARTRNLAPFNLTGQPALSVPCGFDPQGLPMGLQIVGRPFEEETVLRVGHAYQKATAWHERVPGVA